MISVYILMKRLALFTILLLSISAFSQTTLSSEYFNSDWENWNDGGSNASLKNSTPIGFGPGVKLESNSGQSSSTYSDTINLTPYSSASIEFNFSLNNFWWHQNFFVEYSDNGGSSWTQIGSYRNPDYGNSVTYSANITIHSNDFTFSTNSRFRIRTNSEWREMYIDNIIIKGHHSLPEITVKGNYENITDGDTTPNTIDNTDYGSATIGTIITRTFTVENSGNTTLSISNISLSNTTDYSIIGTPYTNTIPAHGSTSFSIQFNSVNTGISTTTVSINNTNSDENSFSFRIKAEATNSFFDSDGDGILDNEDRDDDNDGIEDYVEELACNNSNVSTSTNYKFLNETFGTGNRTQINTTYQALTTYCYENGNGSCDGNIDLGDGKYTVYNHAADGDGNNDTPNGEVAQWADQYWYTGGDHTSGDTNGRMALFNAALEPDIFYTASITGALPNVPVTYSFWVLNLDTSTAPGINERLRPNIRVEFRDLNNILLASIITGDIPPSVNGNPEASWHNFAANLTFPVSEFNVSFYNNQLGGLGNDLAIDDINITQKLCDTDGDGVANIYDLDSDNDGIPDVIEAGFGSISNGKGVLYNIVDTNNNGIHDATEGQTPLDSDSDGVPNYLDLDSDNDGIFDVDESAAGNTSNSEYQNGDGDINGDGVGDGPDTDAVREKDVNSDGTLEYFTDGILDVYDFYNGNTMSSAYGNNNQGMGNTYYVLDSDTDGIPDYMDIYNDTTNTYDISSTLYVNLDTNNNGIINGNDDTDGDGLLDAFDTDNSVFGSPRDLDGKLQLYFDGRNDYVEDAPLLSGWSEISLMGWVKIDPTAGSGNKVLFGQNNFSLILLANNRLLVKANNTSLSYSTPLPTNQWIHLAATYSNTTHSLKLYVNGEEVNKKNLNGSLNTDTTPFYLGKRHNGSDKWFFKGHIDEVRLFNKSLSTNEIQKIVYQEIENNGRVRGTEIPRDISSLSWYNLIKYYRLDGFKGNITDNLATPGIDTDTGARLYNIKQIEYQSAPMPFITQSSGSLNSAVTIAVDGVNGNDAITYDWSIVKVEHNNVTFNNKQKHLGLFINETDANSNPIEFQVTNDSELNVSWYLKLDGFIDLDGESQLIQGEDSMLDPTSIGKIERDQQGTADTFTYNYWSSPVQRQNSASTNYKIMDVMKDGTDPNNPSNINFSSSGYNGAATSPIRIADYWIWKYANSPTNTYSAWQHVRRTGTIFPGEGFTMKGPGTGSISTPQNYVFSGLPNNGDINLTLNANNDYLVGNPYPSTIDANTFIRDNGLEVDYNNSPNENSSPLISGTLYFWEHWGGGSHYLQDYQGGYATYNYSGAVAAAYKGNNFPSLSANSAPTTAPRRYIPVGQGFFVIGKNSGTINFNNGQRVFKKEETNSQFMGSAFNTTSPNNEAAAEEDLRMKFRIGFNSINTISRQLLLTIDENATADVDWAYDGKLNENQIDDMFWNINGEAYTIQGSNEAEIYTTYPLGIKTDSDGINSITIDALENVSDDINIYLHDIALELYHNLRTNDYNVFLNAGEYLDRFEITFGTPEEILGINNQISINIDILYSNKIKKIVLVNPNQIDIKSMTLFNMLGQSVYSIDNIEQTNYSEYQIKNLSVGTYIIKLHTKTDLSVTKKIIVN